MHVYVDLLCMFLIYIIMFTWLFPPCSVDFDVAWNILWTVQAFQILYSKTLSLRSCVGVFTFHSEPSYDQKLSLSLSPIAPNQHSNWIFPYYCSPGRATYFRRFVVSLMFHRICFTTKYTAIYCYKLQWDSIITNFS